MAAVNGAIGEIVGVINGRRSHCGGQDKPVVDINSGMLFEPVMGFILLHDPIRVQITRVFFWFTVQL